MTTTTFHLHVLLAAFVLFVGAIGSTTAQAEWREISYDDVAKMALTLQVLDAQHVFSPYYQFIPGEGQTTLPSDLQLQLKNGNTSTTLSVQPDGKVAIPFRPELVGHDVKLRANQPKARAGLAFQLGIRLPTGKNISYAKLTESIPVMERGIAEMAGIMRFLAPKPSALLIKFAPGSPQTLQLFLPGGRRQNFTTDAQSVVRLPWNRDWLRGAVVLSAIPIELEPDMN